MKTHTEAAFETVLVDSLLAAGYVNIDRDVFDRRAGDLPRGRTRLYPGNAVEAVGQTRSLHGDNTGERILHDLCAWMDTHSSLATLRHGFKSYGRTLRVAFFKAAHELSPELTAQHAANRVGVTRQLHYSTRHENSLDVVLSVNGIPIVTMELKNPLTGQTVQDAIRQYKHDRDPREIIFEFKRRTLVHFAADPDLVFMTSRLAGSATNFLPFNRGREGGAGNPPAERPASHCLPLDEVLCRDSLLDLLARFLHLQIEERRHRRRPQGPQRIDGFSTLPPTCRRCAASSMPPGWKG